MKNKLQYHVSQVKLASDKTYIFPTGFGITFAILSFILLVMAIGYGNNILYFFVFLLVSMGLTVSWQTNKNVECVKLIDIKSDLLFANEKNSISVQLKNVHKKSYLWDIEIKPARSSNEFRVANEINQTTQVVLDWIPAQRGWNLTPRLLVQSKFPFLLFRAWKYFEKTEKIIIYPERKGLKNLSALLGNQSQKDEMAKLENEGLFRDYREFQFSDAPNRIDWKRSVKHQKHLVKNYEKSGERKILIDWALTLDLEDFEQRVSQMAQWVDVCYRQNEVFSLKINDFQTGYFSEALHYRMCLEKLALLQVSDLA